MIRLSFYEYWNRLKFNLLGILFGKNMKICNHIYVNGKGIVSIGNNFKFSSGSNINPISRNIRGSIIAVMKESKIEIGDNVAISSACFWAKDHIIIGDNVNIGDNCLLMVNDAHPLYYRQRNPGYVNTVGYAQYQASILSKPIIIEDDV